MRAWQAVRISNKGGLLAVVVGILIVAGAVWAQDLVVQGKAAVGTTTAPGGGDPTLKVVGSIGASSLGTGEQSFYRATGATLNRWYTSPSTGTALTTGAPSVNTLRATPFIVNRKITLDSIAFNVTTLLAGDARVGIYADNGNLYPGALVVDGGSISTGTAGVKSTAISATLVPGLYWLVHVAGTGAATLRAFAVGSLVPVLGYASTLPTTPTLGWSVAFTFAALPATFPSGGAAITAVPVPAVFVRASAYP